jgi:hypothetical protein
LKPTNKAHDGKPRKVKIEVHGHSDHVVWERKLFYAAEPDKSPEQKFRGA